MELLSALTREARSGERRFISSVMNIPESDCVSVTAIADKLGIEFALIHRQRLKKKEDAPERMEVLVGDVRDKASRVVLSISVPL